MIKVYYKSLDYFIILKRLAHKEENRFKIKFSKDKKNKNLNIYNK